MSGMDLLPNWARYCVDAGAIATNEGDVAPALMGCIN